VRLEVQEFQIVCSLVPSIWLVVETRAWKTADLPTSLEALLDTEVQVVAEVATLLIGMIGEPNEGR